VRFAVDALLPLLLPVLLIAVLAVVTRKRR